MRGRRGFVGVVVVVVAVTVDELSTIRVTALDEFGDPTVGLSARALCEGGSPELACRGPRIVAPLAVRNVGPGTVFVFIERDPFSPGGQVTVTVDIESLVRECNDGVDNDLDLLTDDDDPGCETSLDDEEADPAVAPECSDGLDNDGDLLIDFPDDGDCVRAGDDFELTRCGGAVEVVEAVGRHLAGHALLLGLAAACSSASACAASSATLWRREAALALVRLCTCGWQGGGRKPLAKCCRSPFETKAATQELPHSNGKTRREIWRKIITFYLHSKNPDMMGMLR